LTEERKVEIIQGGRPRLKLVLLLFIAVAGECIGREATAERLIQEVVTLQKGGVG
jgi:hypothetical protein